MPTGQSSYPRVPVFADGVPIIGQRKVGPAICLTLMASGVLKASQTGYDQMDFPASLLSFAAKRGCCVLSSAGIYIPSLGNGTASNNTVVVNKVDGAGNIIAAIATFAVPYNKNTIADIDLRIAGKGVGCQPGDTLRLDTGTLATALAAATISGATNASPIVITTSAAHGFIEGQQVTITSVGGNTNANGIWTVHVLSSTTFSLDGSVGNSNYTSGGTATGAVAASGATVRLWGQIFSIEG